MDVGGDDIAALQLNAEQNDGELPENVNISDVLEAITLADPLYGGGTCVDSMARPPARQPTVEIEEQPASKALRFRYECEGRSAGSIPGARSTAENKTYPTLKVNNYIGPCTIVASCVTKDEPYRPHPHKLVGRDRCDRGVCTIRATITEENPLVQFKNLGIQCVKKKEVDGALQQRAQLRVDPFRTGFDPRTYPSIELNSVRLAFQAFLPDANGSMRVPLRAVASDVIHDKKAMGELCIVRASHCSGTTRGGTQLVLLTEKVSREEVTVIFYDESGWKAPATIVLVHKLFAIVIETPPYRDPKTTDHVNVMFRLQRANAISEDDQSKPFPFEYIPDNPAKRRKTLMQSLMHCEPERSSFKPELIKKEQSPPHQHMYSPVSPYQEQQQRWVPEQMSNLNVASSLNPFTTSDMSIPWQFQGLAPAHAYASLSSMTQPSPMGQMSPSMAQSPGHAQMAVSPGLQHGALSPGMGQMAGSPGLQHGTLSPGMGQMGHVSPGLQQGALSPGMGQMGHVSPGLQHGTLSPGMGQMGHASPGLHVPMGHASPMGHISPGLQQQQQQQQQNYQQMGDQAMDTGTPSISGLLQVDASLPQLGITSAELFSLSSLGEHQQLNDNILRFSSSDLQQLHFN